MIEVCDASATIWLPIGFAAQVEAPIATAALGLQRRPSIWGTCCTNARMAQGANFSSCGDNAGSSPPMGAGVGDKFCGFMM